MNEKPRPLTVPEMREAFLNYVRAMVDYWASTETQIVEGQLQTVHERMSGLAFSILSGLDGSTLASLRST